MPQRKAATKPRGKCSTRAASKAVAAKGSPKAKARSASRSRPRSGSAAGKKEVTIDRRRKKSRRGEDSPTPSEAATAPPPLERRAKVNRRRQIDPTTCERDYSEDEVEFMNAIDDYKRKSGRMFPTCSEVLEVVRSLGYVKLSAAELATRSQGPAADTATPAGAAAGDTSQTELPTPADS